MMIENELETGRIRIDAILRGLNPEWIIIPYGESINTSILFHHAIKEYFTNNDLANFALFVKEKLLSIDAFEAYYYKDN